MKLFEGNSICHKLLQVLLIEDSATAQLARLLRCSKKNYAALSAAKIEILSSWKVFAKKSSFEKLKEDKLLGSGSKAISISFN